MRTLFYFAFFLFSLQVGYSQTYFDGLLHEPVGSVETYVEDDKYVIVPFVDNEVSGTDIILGQTKGFRFGVSALDPFELPDGAYSEWTMVGQASGMADQTFWTERHSIFVNPLTQGITVSFDASPMGAELIQVIVRDVDGEELYSSKLPNGILWTEDFIQAAECPPFCIHTAAWDKTCVARIFQTDVITVTMADGTTIDGLVGEIEYFPVDPAIEPEFCSKVESRSYLRPIVELQAEGISMFENRIPFFELGDIIYETNLEYLKLTQIGDDATDGVRIPVEEEGTFEIGFLNDFNWGNNYQLVVQAKGLIDNNEKDLGLLRQIPNPGPDLDYLVEADFSGLGALKTIQVWSGNSLVEEITDFDGSAVATLNNIPTGCGKRSSLGPPPALPCYFFEFDETTTFQLPGLSDQFEGNELRVLSQTTETVTSLTEIQLRVADVNEFVITQAGVVTSIREPKLGEIDFQVFPNPAQDVLSIQLESASLKEPVEVQIFNNQGQLLLSKTSASASIDIPVAELPHGMYILQVKSDDKVGTQKFIRQ
jgi:hypothetical protein